uniref:Uncharacterized protein n=1 Tax=Romanomermis culicivorax TaxID=13658 RepID=A0A915L917_ROMCU
MDGSKTSRDVQGVAKEAHPVFIFKRDFFSEAVKPSLVNPKRCIVYRRRIKRSSILYLCYHVVPPYLPLFRCTAPRPFVLGSSKRLKTQNFLGASCRVNKYNMLVTFVCLEPEKLYSN